MFIRKNKYFFIIESIKDIDLKNIKKRDKFTIIYRNKNNLEKNSIDMYSSMKSIYLQDREKKIKNTSDSGDDDWGNLDK